MTLFIDEDFNRPLMPGLATLQPGHVLDWMVDDAHYGSHHERVTRRSHAQRLARLQGLGYQPAATTSAETPAATTPASVQAQGRIYHVPSDTLVGCEMALSKGIRSERDFFGGLVPHAFVATKAISHCLHGMRPVSPAHWSPAHAHRVRSSVLDGFSAFSLADARLAGRTLLRAGSVRVKPVRATGGRGQTVARDVASLDRQLAQLPDIEADGVVLERNLRKPRTLSIGQVRVGDLQISYYGLQRLTRNHEGEWVYGGSDLTAVRGDLDTLHALSLAPSLKLAINQVRAYHASVVEHFPGFLASRINYDVAQGRDDAGRWSSGVLEQSWRIGGATGAELAALEVFKADPSRRQVQASCVEVFGETLLPPGAQVYFNEEDPVVGRLTKYSFAQTNAHPS